MPAGAMSKKLRGSSPEKTRLKEKSHLLQPTTQIHRRVGVSSPRNIAYVSGTLIWTAQQKDKAPSADQRIYAEDDLKVTPTSQLQSATFCLVFGHGTLCHCCGFPVAHL